MLTPATIAIAPFDVAICLFAPASSDLSLVGIMCSLVVFVLLRSATKILRVLGFSSRVALGVAEEANLDLAKGTFG